MNIKGKRPHSITMGIKGLNKLIRDVCPNVFHNGNLASFRESIVAVDASLYMYKFVATAGSQWLRCFITMIVTLQKYRIKPIFVFDGEAPPEKEIEWHRRSDKRDSVRRRIKDLKSATDAILNEVTPEEQARALATLNGVLAKLAKTNPMYSGVVLNSLDEAEPHLGLFAAESERIEKQDIVISEQHTERLQELLDIFGLPFIEAPIEGETLASHLAVHKRVSAVLSDDSDVLVYGTPVSLSQVNFTTGTCQVLRYAEVLRGLELTPQQFTDLCIMCGTDYNPNIPKIGPKTAYKLIRKFGSLESIEADGYDTSYLNFRRVRELFRVPSVVEEEIPLIRQPHWGEVRSFCAEYNCQVNIPAVQKYWAARQLVFE